MELAELRGGVPEDDVLDAMGRKATASAPREEWLSASYCPRLIPPYYSLRFRHRFTASPSPSTMARFIKKAGKRNAYS
jgi:hypothetical protein